MNKGGQKTGLQRGDRTRFPYEPRVIGGKLLMPAELQAIHRYVVETPVLEAVTEEIRAVVETVWPELISKLPPSLEMPLKLRPTGLGSGIDKDRPDYSVYTGEWDVGRIYETRGGPESCAGSGH